MTKLAMPWHRPCAKPGAIAIDCKSAERLVMSLPHWIYECDSCKFRLSVGADRYDSCSGLEGRVSLWGGECACVACGTIHLAVSSNSECTLYFLDVHTDRHNGRSWQWRATDQTLEPL